MSEYYLLYKHEHLISVNTPMLSGKYFLSNPSSEYEVYIGECGPRITGRMRRYGSVYEPLSDNYHVSEWNSYWNPTSFIWEAIPMVSNCLFGREIGKDKYIIAAKQYSLTHVFKIQKLEETHWNYSPFQFLYACSGKPAAYNPSLVMKERKIFTSESKALGVMSGKTFVCSNCMKKVKHERN